MTGTILNRCVPAYCPDVRVKWEISGILTYASLIVYDHLEQKIIILTVVNKHSGNRCQRKKAKEKIKSTNNDIIAVYCVRAKHKILCLKQPKQFLFTVSLMSQDLLNLFPSIYLFFYVFFPANSRYSISVLHLWVVLDKYSYLALNDWLHTLSGNLRGSSYSFSKVHGLLSIWLMQYESVTFTLHYTVGAVSSFLFGFNSGSFSIHTARFQFFPLGNKLWKEPSVCSVSVHPPAEVRYKMNPLQWNRTPLC